jgi:hypothetical protein
MDTILSPFSADRLVKREVDNKTKADRSMVVKPLAVSPLKLFSFWKRHFYR